MMRGKWEFKAFVDEEFWTKVNRLMSKMSAKNF
jgi:hypothetical protein